MLYQLELTKHMATAGYNPLVLATIEKDAMMMSHIALLSPKRPTTHAALIAQANIALPKIATPDATRLFFSTQHQMQDQAFDEMQALGDFISQRAAAAEQLASAELQDSTTPSGWITTLSALAEDYSFVLDAANALQDKGLIAMRRSDAFEALTNRPSGSTDADHAQQQLFDKASALSAWREEALNAPAQRHQ